MELVIPQNLTEVEYLQMALSLAEGGKLVQQVLTEVEKLVQQVVTEVGKLVQ